MRPINLSGRPGGGVRGLGPGVDGLARLPYLDPGLPVELLPADWPAPRRGGFGAARTARRPARAFVTAAA